MQPMPNGQRQVAGAALLVVVVWLAAVAGPELVRDRIFPFDSALFAANGALFLRLFQEIGAFVPAPVTWLWDYYNQYPALFLRRHPPLFAVAEAGVYAVTGVSVFGAKLTVLLFACVLAWFCFLIGRRLWHDDLTAAAAALLVVSTPLVHEYMRTVWLDIPALALAFGAVYFYLRRLQAPDKHWRNLAPIVVCALLALYTYQLAIVVIAPLVLHLLVSERRTLWRQPYFWWTGVGTAVLLLPLVVQSVVFAPDNLTAAAGAVPVGWERFVPTESKLSLAYWGHYAGLLASHLPAGLAGVLLWSLLWIKRRPAAGEVLLFGCLVCAYLVFSWFASKTPRYALYLALPALLLTVGAMKTAVELYAARPRLPPHYLVAVLALAIAASHTALAARPFNYHLAGMDRPVTAILTADPSANIFYAGRFDAAFVFYVRQGDRTRRARVHRATVQLEQPEELAKYIAAKRISVLAFEIDAPEEGYARFAGAIERAVAQSREFVFLGKFPLEYQGEGMHGHSAVQVYARARQN